MSCGVSRTWNSIVSEVAVFDKDIVNSRRCVNVVTRFAVCKVDVCLDYPIIEVFPVSLMEICAHIVAGQCSSIQQGLNFYLRVGDNRRYVHGIQFQARGISTSLFAYRTIH